MKREDFINQLYFKPQYVEAIRILGYEGAEPFTFWDAAKKTGVDVGKMRTALFDITRADRREASPPRYELTEDVKKLAFGLLGFPPGHPDYDPERQKKHIEELMGEEEGEAQEKPKKPARKKGGRGK